MLLKNLKRRASFRLLIMLILLISLTGTSVYASEAPKDEGAKTAPPPAEIGIMGDFDPRHIYLETGLGDINSIGNARVELWGRTTASARVDTIGVQFILQRWTGSTWVDVDSRGVSFTRNNANSIEETSIWNVSRGYYYRVKSVHWIRHGSVYESGVRVSGSILVN